jgi:hypothetical protein
MMRKRWLPAALAVLASQACFHQVVQTGRPASSTVIDKPWVSMWLWGLVAAEPIESQPLCRSGVAVVTTEMSFANGLVSALTLGIYTPAHVQITCSSSGRASLPSGAKEILVPAGATLEERADIVNRAVEQSQETHEPVVLRF